MMAQAWSKGDRLVHLECPEWGVGEVLTAEAASHQSTPCQRVTIRFARAGMKTLSTAVARLAPASEASRLEAAIQDLGGWLDDAKKREAVAEVLTSLPEDATDPFRSLKGRIETTCRLFRFTGSGSSLVEWAAAQTGLADPLSQFSRHELEAHFARFRTALEGNLRRLAGDALRSEPALIDALPPEARRVIAEVVKRSHNGR